MHPKPKTGLPGRNFSIHLGTWHSGPHKDPHMKRTLIATLLFPVVLVLAIINHACLALDEILFPAWRKTKVSRPVFIVGMTRTASSWLHKTLYEDRERFTSMKLWEMVFAPSIIQKKGAILLQKMDRLAGRLISRMLRPFDRFIFRGLQKTHPTSFFDIEEDDLVLIQLLSNTLLVFFFPGIQQFRDLPWFDERISPERRSRIIRFYRDCVSRHLFVFGSGRTYLSKSPCHTPKLRSLRQAFPDSRFICTYRDPAHTIPSSLSLFFSFLKGFRTRFEQEKAVQFTIDLAAHWYAYPVKEFASWPASDYIFLEYDRLVREPERTIQNLYRHFNFSMSDAYTRRLEDICKQSRCYISGHRYSAAAFNLREEDLAGRFVFPGDMSPADKAP